MSSLRPTARLVIVPIVVVATVVLSSCGFVLREEAIPEVLPTTTQAPSAFPEGVNPADPDAAPPPVLLPEDAELVEGGQSAAVPGALPTPESYVANKELDELVTPDADLVCRIGASLTWNAANAIQVGLEPVTGEVLIDVDQVAIRDDLLGVAQDIGEVVRRLPEEGARITSPAALEGALDELDGLLRDEVATDPMLARFYVWWAANGRALTEVTSGLAAVCDGEPFTSFLAQWR